VLYRAQLTAVPAPESIAADKGIRRAADKVWVWAWVRAWVRQQVWARVREQVPAGVEHLTTSHSAPSRLLQTSPSPSVPVPPLQALWLTSLCL